LQAIKGTERHLIDNTVGIHELMTLQRTADEKNDTTAEQIAEVRNNMKIVNDKLNNLASGQANLQATLNGLLGGQTRF